MVISRVRWIENIVKTNLRKKKQQQQQGIHVINSDALPRSKRLNDIFFSCHRIEGFSSFVACWPLFVNISASMLLSGMCSLYIVVLFPYMYILPVTLAERENIVLCNPSNIFALTRLV